MPLRTLSVLALDGTPLRRPKPLLLLAYLAFEGTTPRRRLAELFFGGAKDPADSLSTALKYLKHYPAAALEFQPGTVATGVECDAKLLLSDLEKNRLMAAAARYQGPFLATFQLGLGEELEEWVYGTREFLARGVRGALLRLAAGEAAQGQLVAAAGRAERAYTLAGAPELEPEEIEQLHALFLSVGSSRAAELRREAKVVGITLAPTAKSSAGAPPTGIPHNLPGRTTGFVGRDLELAELAALLGQDECRLVTLTGPGGIGKTRLALEAAWAALQHGSRWEGVYFAPLEAVTTPERIPEALARALELGSRRRTVTLEALAEALGRRTVLLILDNFEHLLDGAPLTSELLSHCPQLKLLATSRERLNVEEEWVLSVPGLPLPSTAPDRDAPLQDALPQDAVQLFVQRAKRASLQFALDRANAPHVFEICRAVGGSPLGIELAAAWVRMFSPEDIAREVSHNPDFLSTTSPSLAARHRSVRAAFEHSWKLLKPREQTVLSGLSVFQKGFRREAAGEVVGATLSVLASLVDKSLLRVAPDGRFDRHPLIYGYAQEKLDERERRRLQQLHADYYLALAQQLAPKLQRTKDSRDLETMEQEHENFRAALKFFLEQNDDKALRLSLALGQFWEIRGYLQEGSSWLGKALAHHKESPTTRAKALAILGRLNQLQGEFLQAEVLLEEGLSLWRVADNPPELADCLNRLGTAALAKGDYARTTVCFQEALDLYRAAEDSGGISVLLNNFGDLARCQNDFRAASGFYEASLALTPEIDNVRWKAIVLGNLGSARRALGDVERAEALQKESLALKYRVRDEIGLSYCFAGLAAVAGEQGAFARAATLLGVVDALLAHTKHQLDLADRNDAERTLALVQTWLAPAAFMAARDEGRALSLDGAVVYALGAPLEGAASSANDSSSAS